MTAIHGEVAAGYERVRDAFATNFERRGEMGAAFSLYVRGEKVVDLWGGIANGETRAPWERDTLQLVFSTTKGATAVCAHLLAQRGELDLDAPVADYWPEFAAAGKERIPVRWLLCHKSGLAAFRDDMPIERAAEWFPAVEALAAQEPWWDPGTAHGYHAITYGYLVGEVVRRISGETLGSFFAREVAKPLGLDFWIGLPEAEQHRVATMIQQARGEPPADMPDSVREMFKQFTDPNSMTGRALSNPTVDPNSRVVHAAEIPAANGIGTARSVARMYASLIGDVDGVRLLKPETVEAARTSQARGPDRIIIMETNFGLGFWLSTPIMPLLSPGSFGHPGAGGSFGAADPESGVAVGYVMNRMNANLAGDPRARGLLDAVQASL